MEPTLRQKIARECAEEILNIHNSGGELDQEILELLINCALVRQENATAERMITQLGTALRQRGDAA